MTAELWNYRSKSPLYHHPEEAEQGGVGGSYYHGVASWRPVRCRSSAAVRAALAVPVTVDALRDSRDR